MNPFDGSYWRWYREFEKTRRWLEDVRRHHEQTEALRRAHHVHQVARLVETISHQRRVFDAVVGDAVARRQDTLRLLEQAQAFGQLKWNDSAMAVLKGLRQTAPTLNPIFQALSLWSDRVPSDTLRDISTTLLETGAEEHEAQVITVVTRAVDDALRKDRSRPDTRFIVALVLALLMTLVQLMPGGGNDAQIQAHLDSLSAELLATRQVTEALAARLVLRKARLRARPFDRAAVLGVLAPQTIILPVQRRGKWVKVHVLQGVGARVAAQTGWMLNKYLAPAP